MNNKHTCPSEAPKERRRIHFIGICGVAMSAIAIAFKKAGFEVTGSDAGFFPPVSTNLERNKIDFYPGWHPEKMCLRPSGYATQVEAKNPDLVVVGNVASSTNPEWLYVQKNKLNYKSYPEVIAEYFVKNKSIVCAGTYGKTTTSSLLSWILTQANYDPSYMFGGLAINDFNSAHIGEGDYSVLEGDEYKTARWDNKAKFFHYKPTHLLLTAIEWDHADVYPTEESYFHAFADLVKLIPDTGLIVASEHITHNIDHVSNIIKYGTSKTNDYQYSNVKQTKGGLNFNILNNSNTYNINSPMLGDYTAENITGCFALAHEIGLEPEQIIKSIEDFQGLKRRLEKRYTRDITIFDDIAHSPTKAKFTLQTLRQVYDKKIIAIFEPNTGNRCKQAKPQYQKAFKDATEVIIPRLTKLKLKTSETPHWDGEKLKEVIGKSHDNVKYIEDDNKLMDYVIKNTTNGDVIVFLGSHGFRGMIEQLVSKLNNE